MNLSLNFPDPQTPRQKPALADPLVQRDTSLDSLVNHLEALERQQDSPITAIRRQEARQAKFVELPEAIDPRLREALASREITRLYSHQAEAFERIAAGENIVLPTPTASGKTLCYNLPVLNELLQNSGMCALYLFPTKALAEDQLDEFHGLIEGVGADIRAFTYDGDTPQDARRPFAAAPTWC